MAEIVRRATAGTLESSDAYVELEPGAGEIEIELDSVVEGQFGAQIRRVVADVLDEQGVGSARV